METYLIAMAVALLGGLMMSRLTKKLNLPAVTGYLIAGLLLGPYCLGALKLPYFGFHTLEQVEGFNIVTQTALGFIAFTIGNEFRLHQLCFHAYAVPGGTGKQRKLLYPAAKTAGKWCDCADFVPQFRYLCTAWCL